MDPHSIFGHVSDFSRCRVLVVGDMMIDEYIWGEVDRVSPEAPVPVVSVQSQSTTLGGAGNVVNNLSALGAQVFAASVIGGGPGGAAFRDMFEQKGLETSGLIVEPGRATTKKTRVIAAGQQVVRIDRETKQDITADQADKLTEFVGSKIAETDVVLVSDYGKGVITRPFLEQLFALCEKHQVKTVVDPKGLDFSKYRGAYLLTPNQKEAGLAAGLEINDPQGLFQAADRLLTSLELKKLLVTCGKDGMALFAPGAEPVRIAAEARQVFDVSGAGDTVVSVLGLGLGVGASLTDAARLANVAAGIVVGKVGTATVSQKELLAASKALPYAALWKQKSLEELSAISDQARKQGKKIVMTNGCFDLLHPGHVQLLAQSKALGDLLVVAIDDDESVRAVKGAGRPVLNQGQRVRIISALDSVDYVTVFSTRDLPRVVEAVAPDVLAKGSNWESEPIEGRESVESRGGRVALVPIDESHSAARIIQNIKNGPEPE